MDVAFENSSDEQNQRSHFDQIADAYQAHYGDRYSHRYRDEFIHGVMFGNLKLDGSRVLDAACGSGETTEYLVRMGAHVTGLDISQNMVDAFRARYPTCEGVCGSIFSTGFEDASFDCVSIVGGLHHFHPDVQLAIDEIHRILRPGGTLCFFEPPAGTLPDLARKLWYRTDSETFAQNEASVDVQQLAKTNDARFQVARQQFGGNIAYLLVFNSMVFRIPLSLKPLYSGPALFLESLLTRFQPKWLSCYVICQWQKAGASGLQTGSKSGPRGHHLRRAA